MAASRLPAGSLARAWRAVLGQDLAGQVGERAMAPATAKVDGDDRARALIELEQIPVAADAVETDLAPPEMS